MRIPNVSKTLAVPFSFLVAPLFASAQDLQITEFAADNTAEVLVDEDGDASDWIEVFNPGTSAVALAGYFLSDDAEEPSQWAFPARSIGAGEYLIVFASDKDRSPVSGNLHSNFRLSAGGEALLLSRDAGGAEPEIVSSFLPEYPEQEEGVSYGIGTDGTTAGYFETPTPGAANGTSFAGFVADTSFSVDRGFYTEPFDLVISTETPDATIRYTIDGSAPTESTGTVYDGPLTISETTTLRAAAFRDGFEPTDTDTQTYLFLSDIRTQFADGSAPPEWPTRSVNGQVYDYGMDPDITDTLTPEAMDEALKAIPSMCISISQEDFTERRGIYSNPTVRGRRWERPASLELINPSGFEGFQTGCGIRIRGGASRNPSNPKHAFRIFFRSEYGAGSLDYPLFGTEGATSFEKIDLRTAQNYSWSKDGGGNGLQNTFLREIFGRDLQREMGHPYTKSRYLHLYINGVYWGLYMTQERAEADFGATYFGGDADSFDTLKSAGSTEEVDDDYLTEATDGFLETIPLPGGGEIESDWKMLWNLSRAQEANPTLARYYEMQGLDANGVRDPSLPVFLDVDNLIDYMLIIGFTGNYDAPLSDFIGNRGTNNWYALRDRDRDDKGFSFFIHDGEHSLGAGGRWAGANDRMNTSNSSQFRNDFSRSNPQFIHFDLADSTEEYRIRFADRAQAKLFNEGILTSDRLEGFLDARRDIVDKVIDIEAARWGDAQSAVPRDRDDWQNEVDSLRSEITRRGARFRRHLSEAGLTPNPDAPEITPFGGLLPEDGIVTMKADDGTLYYTLDGSDPRLVGGDVSPQALTAEGESEIILGTSTRVSMRALEDDGEWSAIVVVDFTSGVPATAANLIVSEINYHPAAMTPAEESNPLVGGRSDFEFIEIANVSSVPVDLSGVMISREDIGGQLEGVEDPISNGTLIAPGGRVVVVADREAFAVRYPLVPDALIVGDYSGRLDDGRDSVLLLAADGSQISRVRYDDEAPWPVAADGSGATLDLLNVAAGQDVSLAESWSASTVLGGSPGNSGTGNAFVGDPEADEDEDGVPALLEFAYGSSDQVAGDAPPIQVFPPSLGEGILDVIVTRDTDADGVHMFPEISTDLFAADWSPASNETSVIARIVSDDGETATEIHRVSFPATDGAKRGFLRMRATSTR